MPDIDKFLVTLQKHDGSDLHIASDAPPALRLHGTITQMKVDPLPATQVNKMLDQIMTKPARQTFMERGDADFAYELDGVGRVRCNVFVDRKGPGGVFRLVPSAFQTADQLGLDLSILNFCGLRKGLVLIVGPSSSGKTCTLTSMIDFMNDSRKDHIITIEDPIEFLHDNKKGRINQRELGDHTATYAQALDAAMREDPNIIVLGDLPDAQTMRLAVDTAENGQLVFATLRGTDAVSAVERIIDSFPADDQPGIRAKLSRTLKGVVVQHLCRLKEGHGRVAAREVLIGTDDIAAAIREGRTSEIASLMQTGGRDNMVLLNDALVKLVMDDQIDADEALETAVDATDLRKKLQVAGIEVEE